VLPGEQQPYLLESGEGERYLLGLFLVTTIAPRQDTGSLMEGVVLLGAKNAVVPLYRHTNSHEAIYVVEGSASLLLGDKEFTWRAAIMRASRPAPRTALRSPATEPSF
jgi:quercetin 2,3-dioxygenase